MNPQLPWFVARSAGLVAWGLLSLSVVWGLALRTRVLGRRPTPRWLLDLHRGLGGLATVFTGVHLAALVADSYVEFGLTDLLVPMASAWRPGAVAWGVVGLYLLLAVEVSSLLQRRLPVKWWRRIHQASLPLWVVSSVHLYTAGADARSSAMLVVGLAVFATICFLGVYRVLAPRRGRANRRRAGGRAGAIAQEA